jgi:hypothetical protein
MCLKAMIEDYSSHVSSEKGSFLAKVFGLFKIKIEGNKVLRVILIENQGSRLDYPVVFHLDGRLGLKATANLAANQELDELSRDCIYNDKDFFEIIGKFNVSHADHCKIMQKIERDVKFLQKHLLVEYSLNVLTEKATSLKNTIIHKDQTLTFGSFVVFIGIIDFLQVYDINKKMNKIGKKKFQKYFKYEEFCPKSYRQRFMFMLEKIFNVQKIN